ncbi:MAG: hypothetical protein RBT55_16185 [Rhodocyclaceae bacterium]|nr:hypothetical protein [Rhodocyclaceae bacterium]
MQTLKGEGYRVEFDPATRCIAMTGALRLGGLSEYAPISELLESALCDDAQLTLDLSGLEFLNSSGIATLSKFVITARNRKTCALQVLGSNDIAWQGKSLNNLKRLMPALELSFS